MKVERLHDWQVNLAQARAIQTGLAPRVSRVSEFGAPRLIAGADISVGKQGGAAAGAVVVLSYPALELVETQVVTGRVTFPYVPGFLSFRETPLVLAAFEKLVLNPDLVMVDGQGIAHPRRFGLACHLGLFLDKPTIGCAKSRLCGSHAVPAAEPGSYAELADDGEVIGVALRTRPGVKPLYVSIGHKIDLETAIYWVLACCRGHRLPEPARLAHLAATGNLKDRRIMAKSASPV